MTTKTEQQQITPPEDPILKASRERRTAQAAADLEPVRKVQAELEPKRRAAHAAVETKAAFLAEHGATIRTRRQEVLAPEHDGPRLMGARAGVLGAIQLLEACYPNIENVSRGEALLANLTLTDVYGEPFRSNVPASLRVLFERAIESGAQLAPAWATVEARWADWGKRVQGQPVDGRAPALPDLPPDRRGHGQTHAVSALSPDGPEAA